MLGIIIDVAAHFIFVCVLFLPGIHAAAKENGRTLKEELFSEEE